MSLIYLAGPMSGLPFFNFDAFFQYESYLQNLGWKVWSPARNDIAKHGEFYKACPTGSHEELEKTGVVLSYRTALSDDCAMILGGKITALALMPGWHKSKGVQVEYALAKCLGLEIIELPELGSLAAGMDTGGSGAHEKPTAGYHSKALTANPKDLFGSVKVSLTKLPAVAVMHAAHAMMNGAEKYGPYNWRDKQIIASIYIDAAMRHLQDWFEGQETASDSEVHHLGHAIACCAILLDAQETGNLIDDRPIAGDPDVADRVLTRLSEIIKRRTVAKKAAAENAHA
jgi:hypothetical protein